MAKTKATILVIDDDEDILLSAKLLLKKHFTEIITRNNPREINLLFSTAPIDVIVLDMNYRIGFNDGKEGMYWLKHILSVNPEMVVILMTAYGQVELAVDAIKELLDVIDVSWRLSDYDIPDEDLPKLVDGAMKQARLFEPNPKNLAEKDVKSVYEAAF